MANRKTFNDFIEQTSISEEDYVVGFDSPSAGGERKFKLGDLKNFIKDADLTDVESSAFNITGHTPDFFSGKVFHITSGDINQDTNEVTLQLPYPMNSDVRFIIVNMLDPNENGDVKVKITNKVNEETVHFILSKLLMQKVSICKKNTSTQKFILLVMIIGMVTEI